MGVVVCQCDIFGGKRAAGVIWIDRIGRAGGVGYGHRPIYVGYRYRIGAGIPGVVRQRKIVCTIVRGRVAARIAVHDRTIRQRD